MFAANSSFIGGIDPEASGFARPAAFLANPDEVHFMLDLETLSVDPNAAITEIGCVRICTGRTFHLHVVDPYGARSPETIIWRTENNLPWQTVVAQEHNCYGLYPALSMFFDWLQLEADGKEIVMWCKGTDFDKVIATAAAKTVDLKVPWKYSNFFDVRTLLKLFPEFKIPKEMVTHNALEDAILQARQLAEIAEVFDEIKQEAGM